jgi:catechol 2,3-dioxygenase-like lactoylglutathione lyase family enzyme
MSIIKIEDVTYIRYRAPDLDRMRQFLSLFGMIEAASSQDALFMRGRGDAPFLHWTERGAAGAVCAGFRAASVTDLETLCRAVNGVIEPLTAPGGGCFLRLRDPDGFLIEVVAGQRHERNSDGVLADDWNSVTARRRVGTVKRLVQAPAHVERLGHYVVRVTDYSRSEAWYKEHLGLIVSDVIHLADGRIFGAFLRCDRGHTPTDHHTVALMQTGEAPGYHHSAYEVRNIDDLMIGHDYLRSHGCAIDMGIGRHLLGSQVFTYWLDPWGQRLEHWTDGDLLTSAQGPGRAEMDQLHSTQWGVLSHSSEITARETKTL